MGHIELARWPDLILVAPASANFLARLAQGLASDLLSTLCLATDRPIAVAPAMNRVMWANPATQSNVAALKSRGVRVLGPGDGAQACGEMGEGRMLEPLQIRDAVADLFGHGPLGDVAVTLTAGPTREAVDPVRVLSNRSSGKQGFALAHALAGLGARVTLVSGPVSLETPRGVTRVDVESAQEMLEASLQCAAGAQIFVGAAAVADYRPARAAGNKIKKKDEALTLALERTEDILERVRAAHPKLFMVGFAAETEDLERNARDKLVRKKLDLVAANWVGNGRAFDQDHNALHVYWKDGAAQLQHAAKTEVARELAGLIAERYRSARTK